MARTRNSYRAYCYKNGELVDILERNFSRRHLQRMLRPLIRHYGYDKIRYTRHKRNLQAGE